MHLALQETVDDLQLRATLLGAFGQVADHMKNR
jgi:truncated hemoglobin YjbI